MKNELLISLIDGDIVENEELNLRSDNVVYCQEAIPTVKEYETIIKWWEFFKRWEFVKIVEVLEKYPKLKKSSLMFLKNYIKSIKQDLKNRCNEFRYI